MATMYVYNIPPNETVNLRSTPNGTVLVRVGYGKAVDASPSTTSGWHNASYNGYTGYIMSQYLTYTNPSGGGSSGGGTHLGTGTVIGGGPLYCRKQPIAGYEAWGQFQEGTTIQIYSCTTSGWYETRWPATGNNVGYVMSKYISMSGSGGKTFTKGKFGATTATAVFARKQPSTASGTAYDSSEKLRLGSTFLIEGTESGTAVNGNTTWVKVRYGTSSGTSTDAYIHSDYFAEKTTTTPSTAKERCIEIANSLDGVHERVLGLSGECCQHFIYWLCGACGKTVSNMPYHTGFCGPARDYFNNSGRYQAWNTSWANSHQPSRGDLVYYGTPGAATSPHVGLVIEVNPSSKQYTSIECNLSDRVKRCTGSYLTGYCADNRYNIQGFASPSWT